MSGGSLGMQNLFWAPNKENYGYIIYLFIVFSFLDLYKLLQFKQIIVRYLFKSFKIIMSLIYINNL